MKDNTFPIARTIIFIVSSIGYDQQAEHIPPPGDASFLQALCEFLGEMSDKLKGMSLEAPQEESSRKRERSSLQKFNKHN